jgi:hypothetical protein
MQNPFRYFNSSPEVIRLAMMMYVRYPLSLRLVEDLLFERDIFKQNCSTLWPSGVNWRLERLGTVPFAGPQVCLTMPSSPLAPVSAPHPL